MATYLGNKIFVLPEVTGHGCKGVGSRGCFQQGLWSLESKPTFTAYSPYDPGKPPKQSVAQVLRHKIMGLLQVLNERIQREHVDKQFVVSDEHWTNGSCVTGADVHYVPVFRVLVLGGRGIPLCWVESWLCCLELSSGAGGVTSLSSASSLLKGESPCLLGLRRGPPGKMCLLGRSGYSVVACAHSGVHHYFRT